VDQNLAKIQPRSRAKVKARHGSAG